MQFVYTSILQSLSIIFILVVCSLTSLVCSFLLSVVWSLFTRSLSSVVYHLYYIQLYYNLNFSLLKLGFTIDINRGSFVIAILQQFKTEYAICLKYSLFFCSGFPHFLLAWNIKRFRRFQEDFFLNSWRSYLKSEKGSTRFQTLLNLFYHTKAVHISYKNKHYLIKWFIISIQSKFVFLLIRKQNKNY